MSDWQYGAAPFPQPTAEEQAMDKWLYERMLKRGEITEIQSVVYHRNIGEYPVEND